MQPYGTGIDGQQAYNSFNNLFGAGPFISTGEWEDDVAPKAYINYILFDENFVLQDFGFNQVSVAAKQVGTTPVVAHDYLNLNVQVAKKGYLYVYLSNENPTQANVYFDDLKIVHNSAIEQMVDYYPFGLAFNSYQRENAVEQNYLYNGKELQDELGLGWLDYGWRMYSADIGRFMCIDPHADSYNSWTPYNYVGNNPILLIDPDGRDWFVNGQDGSMVYIKGVVDLSEESLKNVDANVVKGMGDMGNWTSFGNDTMFDTKDNKISENADVMVMDSEYAGTFMENRGYELAVQENVTEVATKEIDVSSPVDIEFETKEVTINSSRLTYAKEEDVGVVRGTVSGTSEGGFMGGKRTMTYDRIVTKREKDSSETSGRGWDDIVKSIIDVWQELPKKKK